MDKQFKLTDRVSKDSIKSPIFKKWVKRILCIACILSLALQLTLCCLPMNASAAESDSIVGTWVFNDIIDLPIIDVNIDFTCNGSNYTRFYSSWDSNYKLLQYGRGATSYFTYSSRWSKWIFNTNGANVSSDIGKTITINSDSFTYNGGTLQNVTAFASWLKDNAIKIVEEVYDFTGETRIFNDELTLFNTSDATWTESFSFNFEVLGVGTADYIILQRTTQNNYTMSYSFDFEDSGGLTMIYRDSPPFDNGESEWLGGKVNRKVITFLSNPDNPDFQQWLLDNTTIFDNVTDAYLLGQQSGYNNGYEEGFANSLIGDSLSGPINALSQITLIEIQGTAITLGGVVMTAIALCLVLAFLKLYAGG